MSRDIRLASEAHAENKKNMLAHLRAVIEMVERDEALGIALYVDQGEHVHARVAGGWSALGLRVAKQAIKGTIKTLSAGQHTP